MYTFLINTFLTHRDSLSVPEYITVDRSHTNIQLKRSLYARVKSFDLSRNSTSCIIPGINHSGRKFKERLVFIPVSKRSLYFGPARSLLKTVARNIKGDS